MKEKMKFIVAVFGVTIATFGSLNVKAAAWVRCNGTTGSCAKVALSNGSTPTMVGDRTSG